MMPQPASQICRPVRKNEIAVAPTTIPRADNQPRRANAKSRILPVPNEKSHKGASFYSKDTLQITRSIGKPIFCIFAQYTH